MPPRPKTLPVKESILTTKLLFSDCQPIVVVNLAPEVNTMCPPPIAESDGIQGAFLIDTSHAPL